MKNTVSILAHLALFIVQLIYAGNYTIAKEVMPNYVSPLGLVFLRIGFGMIAFWVLHFLLVQKNKTSKKPSFQKKDFWLLALCGLLGTAINQMLFLKGLNLTTPINASIIMLIGPIWLFVGSVLFLKEGYSRWNILGITLGCVGAGILLSYGRTLSFETDGLLGDLFILINATSYSTYLLLVRRLIRKYDILDIVKWVFTFGFLFSIPFTYPELIKTDWTLIVPAIWWAIAYILIGVTFITYLFNAFALTRLSPRVVGAYIYLQPILATMIALLAQKDELSVVKILAGALIFAGVYLTTIKPKVS